MSPRLSLSDGRATHFGIEGTETDHRRNGADHAGAGPEWRSHATSPRGERDQHVTRGFGDFPAPLPVVIIDDHLLFGAVLRMALACKGIMARQLSIAGGEPAILHQLGGAPRGLVLLDLHLGHTENGRRIDGVELVAPLRTRGWTVLAITDSDDLGRIASAVAAGALGVVSKSSSFDVLLATLAAAVAGDDVMSPGVRYDLIAIHRDNQSRGRRWSQCLERLSPREREVLELLEYGYRITAIAEHFVVSKNTVRTQVRAILVKLDVNSQLEAAAFMREHRPSPKDQFAPGETGDPGQHCFQCGKREAHHWPWCSKNARIGVLTATR
jgi:DNA-binding NarL/FixJ family response regulator